jgi:hypothetical protein
MKLTDYLKKAEELKYKTEASRSLESSEKHHSYNEEWEKR